MVIVSFATTLASYEFFISDFGPKNATISIIEGETLKLYCEPKRGWYICEFTHENNGKSCKMFSDQDAIQCENGTGEMYREDRSCFFEVKNLKKGDAGRWTCEISDANSKSDKHEFAVAVQDKPPTTDKSVSTVTRPTEFMTLSILVFTFLIVF